MQTRSALVASLGPPSPEPSGPTMSRFLRAAAVLLALEAGLTVAAPTARATGPTVKLDNGTFVGTTSGSVSKFLGIPFAQSP